MRNLKRALSLAMATVMSLSMMTVGASAKGLGDFSDAAEVVNKDAVAVTSEIGIFAGYDDGEFKGENTVTRAEMAVIISKMLYGADVKVAQFAEMNTFTDVPAWAEGYVNLCASLGIITGRGNGIFDPSATITTAEAAMMLTKTLGYFKSQKDFGSDWMLAATAKATQLGLYGDLKLSAKEGLTRDNVAEMVFNALTKAVPVQYNDLLGVYYNENQGVIYALEFNYLETLGYKNFDLVYVDNDVTTYGRPATTWGFGYYNNTKTPTASGNKAHLTSTGGLIADDVVMLSNDEIVTIAHTPDYTFTGATKEKDVYKVLGASVCNDKGVTYDWEMYVDGDYQEAAIKKPSKGISTRYENTNNGAVTEVYINSNPTSSSAGTVTLVQINNYLGEVTKVKEDDDGVYAIVKMLSKRNDNVDDIKVYTDIFEEGDLVVATVDCLNRHADPSDPNEKLDSYYATLQTPGTIEGVVTQVNYDKDDKNSYLKMGDDKHTYSVWTVGDLDEVGTQHPNLKEEYRLFTDENGYVLGFTPVTESMKQYLYVMKAHEALSIQAKVMLPDGTIATVDVNNKWNDGKTNIVSGGFTAEDLAGHVFAYTVSDKGVYTLEALNCGETGAPFVGTDFASGWHEDDKAVDENGDLKYVGAIANGESYIFAANNRYFVDGNTIFVDVKAEKSYIGIEEVPNYIEASFIVAGENRAMDVVYILDGVKYNEDADYVWIDEYKEFDTVKYDGKFYYIYKNAYIDGEKISNFYVEREMARSVITGDGLYKIDRVVDEDYIIALSAVDLKNAKGNFETIYDMGNNAFWMTENGLPNFDPASKMTFDNETVWVYVNEKNEATVGSYKDVIENNQDRDVTDGHTVIKVLKTDAKDKKLARLVYVLYADEIPTPVVNEGNSGVKVTSDPVLNVKTGEVTFTIEFDSAAAAKATSFVVGNTYRVMLNNVVVTAKCEKAGELTVTVPAELAYVFVSDNGSDAVANFVLQGVYEDDKQAIEITDDMEITKDDVSNKEDGTITPDEPGTDEPGTDEPGTDEPGTDEPGTDEPGTDEPGTEAPSTEGAIVPGTVVAVDDKDDNDKTAKLEVYYYSGNIASGDELIDHLQDILDAKTYEVVLTSTAAGKGYGSSKDVAYTIVPVQIYKATIDGKEVGYFKDAHDFKLTGDYIVATSATNTATTVAKIAAADLNLVSAVKVNIDGGKLFYANDSTTTPWVQVTTGHYVSKSVGLFFEGNNDKNVRPFSQLVINDTKGAIQTATDKKVEYTNVTLAPKSETDKVCYISEAAGYKVTVDGDLLDGLTNGLSLTIDPSVIDTKSATLMHMVDTAYVAQNDTLPATVSYDSQTGKPSVAPMTVSATAAKDGIIALVKAVEVKINDAIEAVVKYAGLKDKTVNAGYYFAEGTELVITNAKDAKEDLKLAITVAGAEKAEEVTLKAGESKTVTVADKAITIAKAAAKAE